MTLAQKFHPPETAHFDMETISAIFQREVITVGGGKIAGKTAMHVILWPKFLQFVKNPNVLHILHTKIDSRYADDFLFISMDYKYVLPGLIVASMKAKSK